MNVGLIARSNARGLGTQTYEAWRGYPFHSVLHVLDDNPRWPERPDLYPGAHIAHWQPKMGFEPGPLIEFMQGLDVIFSVETLYDWSLVHMANNRGIRTIVQGNPEFMRHNDIRWADTPHPTMWCFPTPWIIDQMPSQRILPVPAPIDVGAKPGLIDDPLVVVHVAGHRAAGDRNGTEFVVDALRHIRRPMTLRIVGQDGPNTIFRERETFCPEHVTLELVETGVEDRWSLYEGAHLCLLPRRYGGLCLPAIEAMACGVVPMMPNCSPNEIWPIEVLSSARGRSHLTPFGHVETETSFPLHLAHTLDDLEKCRERIQDKREEALAWAAENSWERLRSQYDQIFHDRP